MPVIKQSDVFLQGEGDAWHERNKDKPRLPDPVIDAIEACQIKPTAVLELGCGTGWRLAEIQKRWPSAVCTGSDPSAEAVKQKVFERVWRGHALETVLNVKMGYYDLIIFGFCLYLVDREDLMMIAAHTDRVLKDGGHIIIHDFGQPIEGVFPYKTPYKHKEGIWSYHVNYVDLWLGCPGYKLVYGLTPGPKNISVDILKKDMANAYPERKI